MAIKKEIELDNGVIVNYHRIVNISKITNVETIIEVASYTSEEKRQEEINYYEEKEQIKEVEEGTIDVSQKEPMNVYIFTEYINKEYNEQETIEDIYDYLKTLDKYKDSKDV